MSGKRRGYSSHSGSGGRLSNALRGLGGLIAGALRPVLVKVVVLVLLAGVVLGGVWGFETYFGRMERYQVYADTLMLEKLPDWVTPQIRRELLDLKGLPERFSICETGICRKIAASFEAVPWVENVISVKRVYPNRITVELNLRRPIVGVKAERMHYLTDARGFRVSRALADWPPEGFDVPLIFARTVGEVPARGRQWRDFGVLSGVAVQTYLMRAPLQTRIKLIDLTNLDGQTDARESEVVLWTERNTRIDWGRSPLRLDSPGELSPLHKIAKMIDFERRSGPMSLYGSIKIHYDEISVDGGPRPLGVMHTDG